MNNYSTIIPSPFFLYLSQDFKLISLSGPQNMMFSLADVYLIFSSLGGVGEQVLGLIGFTLSMFALIVKGCLPYWLGKGIPVPSLIDLTHANSLETNPM